MAVTSAPTRAALPRPAGRPRRRWTPGKALIMGFLLVVVFFYLLPV